MLVELYEMLPDVRIGQLLAHLGILGEDQTGRTLWDIDDDEFLAVLYRHREELAARKPDRDARESAPLATAVTCDLDATHTTEATPR